MPPQEVEAEGKVETEVKEEVGNKAKRARPILMTTDVTIVGNLVIGPENAKTPQRTETKAKTPSPKDNGRIKAVVEVTGEAKVIEVEEAEAEEIASNMQHSPTPLPPSLDYQKTMRMTLQKRAIPLVMLLSLIF
jgi:hypothetical protein